MRHFGSVHIFEGGTSTYDTLTGQLKQSAASTRRELRSSFSLPPFAHHFGRLAGEAGEGAGDFAFRALADGANVGPFKAIWMAGSKIAQRGNGFCALVGLRPEQREGGKQGEKRYNLT